MRSHLAAAVVLFSFFSLSSLAFTQESTLPRDVSGAEMASQIVKKIAPTYPEEARRARIQGTVILKVEISKTGDVESVALVSGDAKKLKVLSKKYKTRINLPYEKYDELLQSGEIDAVYIALPNDLHREYAERAAAAGIHAVRSA